MSDQMQGFSDQKEYLEIDAEEARELAYEYYGGDLYKTIRNEFVETWRWGNTYELIIEDVAGNFWRTYWRDSSGDGDWKTFDDGGTLTFRRVIPREKVVIEYVNAD